MLLWCGSCSFGTPLYAHLFSLNHSCKQVGSAFFPCRFWIEFKAPGNPSLLTLVNFKAVQHNSVGLHRRKPGVPCIVNGIPDTTFLVSKTVNHQVITFVESDSSVSQTVLLYTFYPVFFHVTCQFTFRTNHLGKHLFLAQRFLMIENCLHLLKSCFCCYILNIAKLQSSFSKGRVKGGKAYTAYISS